VAKRKKDKPSDPKRDLLVRIRERYKAMSESDHENRRDALEDIKFVNVPGEQWDEAIKRERGNDRPCYEFNKLRITSKRVINDMRSNRPQGKVRAVEDGDKKTAEIYEGLIRNIWNTSDGDTVIDYAAQYQVDGGMGAWRIDTRYVAEDAFEQDIILKEIPNPFCLLWDPAAKDQMKRDAADWILTERISKKSYEARWPDKEVIEFDLSEFDDEDDWNSEESVRIVEYWFKEPYEKEIWQLRTGEVVDSTADEAKAINPAEIAKRRTVTCQRIKMCIASGESILEQSDWAGSHFPFVVVFGEYIVIDGKVYWFGLPRFAKDSQRSYNVTRTAVTETIGLAPQSKFWATPEQAEGHLEKWGEAHKKLFPFLLYNADARTAGAPPQRMGGPDVPVALIQELQISSEEIKAVTGIYDASLGNKSNEQTGRAILARQSQGEIATFNFADNMGKAIRRTWELLIDLAPKIYDTERELRILGNDGAEDYVKVNKIVQDPQTGQPMRVNDLSHGRYDVAVTVGPSFTTRRQEAAEVYLQMANAVPQLMGFAGDLIFKAMDLPYSDDIADRLKAMLPPPIQQMLQQGKQIPPEAQQVMAQAAQAMQMVEQKSQLVLQAEQELKELQAQAKGDAANAKIAQANIKTAEAQLESRFGELELAMRELELKKKELEMAAAMLAKDQIIAGLKITNAHQKASAGLAQEEMEARHTLENQSREVNEQAKDAGHALENQSRDISDQISNAQHSQELHDARTEKRAD
jgi:hypothetical protein